MVILSNNYNFIFSYTMLIFINTFMRFVSYVNATIIFDYNKEYN